MYRVLSRFVCVNAGVGNLNLKADSHSDSYLVTANCLTRVLAVSASRPPRIATDWSEELE